MLTCINLQNIDNKEYDVDYLFGNDGFINNMYSKIFNDKAELDKYIVMREVISKLDSLQEENKYTYYVYPTIETSFNNLESNISLSPLNYNTLKDAIINNRYDILWINYSKLKDNEKAKWDIMQASKIPTIIQLNRNVNIDLINELKKYFTNNIYKSITGNYFILINCIKEDNLQSVEGGSPFIEHLDANESQIVETILDNFE
jgi:hypothetical protein